MTREEKVAKLTRQIAQGGWTSIYSFVDDHATEEDFDDEEENENEDEEV